MLCWRHEPGTPHLYLHARRRAGRRGNVARLLPHPAGLRRRHLGHHARGGLAHIGEMAGMIVERLVEEGAPIPVAPDDQEPTAGERIVVTVCAPLEDAPYPA